MEDPAVLISVIIPCFNYGQFLPEALGSVIAQSYPHWECIVVDDGSTDDTALVTKRFVDRDERIRYVYQQHEGIAAARNTGIRISSGAFIQLLDADDKLQPHKFRDQLRLFAQHPETDIVYGDALFFHSDRPSELQEGRDGQVAKGRRLRSSGSGAAMVRKSCINNFIDTAAPLIRRGLIEKVGEFVNSYKTYEDWHFWFRCALNDARFWYDPSDGMNYYHRYGHTSAMGNRRQLVADGIRIRRYMHRFLPFDLKLYNLYRLSKLLLKKYLLRT